MADVIFAIVILTIGFMVIVSESHNDTTEIPVALAASNAMDLLSEVRVQELCPDTAAPCACDLGNLTQLCDSSKIGSFNQTLLSYFGELYYKASKGDAQAEANAMKLFGEINSRNDLVRTDAFKSDFRIIDGADQRLLYSSINPPDISKSKSQSKELIASRRILIGFYEDPAKGIVQWGPYIAEVDIWA